MAKKFNMTMEKHVFQSRTFWVGVLTVFAGIASGIAGELQSGVTLTVLGVVNIVLRVLTKSGVKF